MPYKPTSRRVTVESRTFVIDGVFALGKTGTSVILGTAASLLVSHVLPSTGSKQPFRLSIKLSSDWNERGPTNMFSVFAASLELRCVI